MRISIRVKPKSRTQDVIPPSPQLLPDSKEPYVIKLKSAPKKGAANKELIELLAEHFRVTKKQIQIVSGVTSRNKIVEIRPAKPQTSPASR